MSPARSAILDPYYLELMNGMQQMLRSVMRTQNRMTMAMSATGSAGMEATVVNLIEPGDSMVVCVNGVFGERMVDVADAGRPGDARRSAVGRRFSRRPTLSRPCQGQAEGGGHRHGRNFDRRLAADRRDLANWSMTPVPCCWLTPLRPGRSAGRSRRLADRRHLLRHAEVPELPAGPCAGLVQPAGDGSGAGAQDQGAELVPRRVDAGQVLGRGTGLSPHRADQHDLRGCTKPCGWFWKKGSKPATPGTC